MCTCGWSAMNALVQICAHFPFSLPNSKCCSYVFGKEYQDNDQTIEILMSDLDPKIMEIFHKKNSLSAEQATEVVDSYLYFC